MTSVRDDTGLLKILRGLYSRITKFFIKTRKEADRKHPGAGRSLNIVSPLAECVDKLSADVVPDENSNVGDIADSQSGITENVVSEHYTTSVSVSSSAEVLGDLSKYFRSVHQHSVVSLNAGEKLMQSTWEHIHTSIRTARQGDVKTARMHVELANNALREAEHYLSATVYSSFAMEVVETIDKINSHEA